MGDADSETPEEKLAFLKKHGVVVETPVPPHRSDPPINMPCHDWHSEEVAETGAPRIIVLHAPGILGSRCVPRGNALQTSSAASMLIISLFAAANSRRQSSVARRACIPVPLTCLDLFLQAE